MVNRNARGLPAFLSWISSRSIQCLNLRKHDAEVKERLGQESSKSNSHCLANRPKLNIRKEQVGFRAVCMQR